MRLPAAISTPARGMGVGFQRIPFGGFAFISPVFRIHVHVLVLNYIKCITCTVRSPTYLTRLLFELINTLKIYLCKMDFQMCHLSLKVGLVACVSPPLQLFPI